MGRREGLRSKGGLVPRENLIRVEMEKFGVTPKIAVEEDRLHLPMQFVPLQKPEVYGADLRDPDNVVQRSLLFFAFGFEIFADFEIFSGHFGLLGGIREVYFHAAISEKDAKRGG